MRARRVAVWLLAALLGGSAPLRADEAPSEASDELAPADPGSEDQADDELADDEELTDDVSRRDPLEGLNRDIFAFNRRVDRYFFDPITRGYQVAVPQPGRRAIYRAFKNLDSPVILANHMLQLRPIAAATTSTRFVINTSVGLLGFFDPAETVFHVQRLEGDFGQTLARYGTPSGPFLMLPVFGPSTLRDVCGDVVDIVADPLSYLLGPYEWWTLLLGGGAGISTREAHLDDLHQLEDASIDFYSALRSAYLQSRAALIEEARAEFTRAATPTEHAAR